MEKMASDGIKNIRDAVSGTARRILDELDIVGNPPGSILRDFGVFLDYIGKNAPVPITMKTGYLPRNMFLEINERLSRPVQTRLKNPRMTSYPNVAGLYLLLRASGISWIHNGPKQRRLSLDGAALARWMSLNSVEKYFSLLETLLLRATPTLIKGSDWFYGRVVSYWSYIFKRVPENGMYFLSNAEGSELFYNPDIMLRVGLSC